MCFAVQLTSRLWLSALLFSLEGVAGGRVLGQPSKDPPPTQQVSSESLQLLRKKLAESTDLDAEAKAKIETLCAQAQEGLKKVTDLGGQAEQFKNDAEEVQERVAELRRRLAQVQSRRLPPFAELTLPELEQEVSRREVALTELKAAQTKSEAEPASRANRRREIRAHLLSAGQRLADIQKQLDTPAPADEPPLLTDARRAALQVRRVVGEAEQPTLQNELAKYDAEDAADYVRVERDLRTQEVATSSTELETLEGLLGRRRAADLAAAVQRAEEALRSAPTSLKPHAEKNLVLAKVGHALSGPIEATRRKLEKTKQRLEEVQKQFKSTQQRVQDIGLTGSIGALLRRQRTSLPNLGNRRKDVQNRKTLIENVQYELFEFDDLRSESADKTLQTIMADLTDPGGEKLSSIEEAAKPLVDQRRLLLDGLIRNYNNYLDIMFELDATEQRLIRETEHYHAYIDERVLWIRSNRPLLSAFGLDSSDSWALSSQSWSTVGEQLKGDLVDNPLTWGVFLSAFLILLTQRGRIRREMDAKGQAASRGSCIQFSPTFQATFYTLMIAITWPGVLLFLAWRLNLSSNGQLAARELSQALLAVSWVYFPMELLRLICRPGGLADAHFSWPRSAIAVLAANLKWTAMLGIPVVFVAALLYLGDSENGVDAIERICLMLGMVILAIFASRVLKPDSGIFREYLSANPHSWFSKLQVIWYWGCVLVPLTIAGMTFAGYYYTALQLAWRLYATFMFVAALHLLWSLLRRLLLVRRRAIYIQQAKERRAASAGQEGTQSGPGHIVTPEDLHPDVATNTEQSQRLIRTGLVAASLVGMWLIWVNVLPALRILNQWPVWTTTTVAKQQPSVPRPPTPGFPMPITGPVATADSQSVEVISSVTVADVGLALLIGFVTIVCARNIPGLMEISLLQRLPLDNSIRYAITTVTSYAIVLLGIILAFNAISIGWSKVQWLATALMFGLAFGLQEVFANFVAGLILLFERPIRVGDVVTVDEVTGVVSRIRIRATTITNWDRKEYVIPNKEFITGRMLNWTLSDKTNRIVINVGVAYGSDVDLAKQLLLNACTEHPLVLKDPPSVVTFEGFGESSLNLVVRTFLPNLDNRLKVIDQLHSAIDFAFRRAGIQIAFPQRDLHLRSADHSVLSVTGPERNAA